MNPKQLKRIAIALVVVLFFWGMSEILGGRHDDTEIGFVLPALQASEVDSVIFATGTAATVLARAVDNTWTVNGYEMNPDAVTELFQAVSDSVEVELVATSAVVHERMGLDSASGIRVDFIRDGQSVAAVIFGNTGRGYGSRYVRRATSDFVFLYKGALANLVARSVDTWRDKRILDISPDSIARVAVERGGEDYSLVREGGEWRFGTGAPADSGAVHRMLERYQALYATGFPSDAQLDSVDFNPPDRQVTLFSSLGDTLGSVMFDSTNAGYWVQRASGGYIYKIAKWSGDQMSPADSTLRPSAGDGD
ncbi:MAG: DUF4340 domain-containing protein [Gemmatimonadota bacterium]|nr:MAG: DUF4340 domain-containing protein [Gemmatimonadota bacterium]